MRTAEYWAGQYDRLEGPVEAKVKIIRAIQRDALEAAAKVCDCWGQWSDEQMEEAANRIRGLIHGDKS